MNTLVLHLNAFSLNYSEPAQMVPKKKMRSIGCFLLLWIKIGFWWSTNSAAESQLLFCKIAHMAVFGGRSPYQIFQFSNISNILLIISPCSYYKKKQKKVAKICDAVAHVHGGKFGSVWSRCWFFLLVADKKKLVRSQKKERGRGWSTL